MRFNLFSERIRFFSVVTTFFCFFCLNIFSQQTVTYEPSDEVFSNPERGFYSYTQSWNGYGILTNSQLGYVRQKKQSLIYRIHYIPGFREADLPASFLTFLDNDFQVMRENGIKCVLRFAYSNDIGVEDASLTRILGHLDQLKDILERNYDVIAFMQAGFIGAWGEWHSSEHNLDNLSSRKTILNKILEVLPKERMVQLRTPSYKQTIFGNYSPVSFEQSFNESDYSRTGHHNDCFLASYEDWGTYTDTTSQKLYISNDTKYVPLGGETCNPSSFSECANAIYQMKRLHWTYINNDYHQTVISGWRTYGCYDDIAKNIGYRFELLEGAYSDSAKPGGVFHTVIKLRNVGFASLYNLRDFEILIRNSTDTFYVKLPVDPRYWQSGDTTEINYDIGIPLSIPSGNYELLMNLPDSSPSLKYNPQFSVRFANQDIWEQETGYNNLKASLNINPQNESDDYNGDLFFQRFTMPTGINEIEGQNINYKMQLKNYPNPFNSQTTIFYTTNSTGNVSLKMYDTIGREIVTLVNETQAAGQHLVDFDAKNCSSGIYFLVLSTKDNLVTQKAILLK